MPNCLVWYAVLLKVTDIPLACDESARCASQKLIMVVQGQAGATRVSRHATQSVEDMKRLDNGDFAANVVYRKHMRSNEIKTTVGLTLS